MVAVGANEAVVPAFELQEAKRCIKQLEGAIGRKTLENEVLKETVFFTKTKNVDCALACNARERKVRAVREIVADQMASYRKRLSSWLITAGAARQQSTEVSQGTLLKAQNS